MDIDSTNKRIVFDTGPYSEDSRVLTYGATALAGVAELEAAFGKEPVHPGTELLDLNKQNVVRTIDTVRAALHAITHQEDPGFWGTNSYNWRQNQQVLSMHATEMLRQLVEHVSLEDGSVLD